MTRSAINRSSSFVRLYKRRKLSRELTDRGRRGGIELVCVFGNLFCSLVALEGAPCSC
jgi:hypothetical protein